MTAPPITAAQAAAAPTAGTDDKKSERRLAFVLITPAVLLMLAVTAYPIGYAVWLSLQRYNLATPDDTSFVWLQNYITVLSDRYWWTAFVVTLAITVVSVAIEFVNFVQRGGVGVFAWRALTVDVDTAVDHGPRHGYVNGLGVRVCRLGSYDRSKRWRQTPKRWHRLTLPVKEQLRRSDRAPLMLRARLYPHRR